MSTNNPQKNKGSEQNIVRIEPWGKGDLPLLKKTLGDPAMTEHLGGPESDEKLARRQALFEQLADSGEGRMFKIIYQPTGESIGSVGYWEHAWRDEDIYEIGWSVLLAFQGRGIGGIATAQAIVEARRDGKHRFLHAFPSVKNPPSNAICRKLGFTLIEECDFEYPKGHLIRCNDWRLDLTEDK